MHWLSRFTLTIALGIASLLPAEQKVVLISGATGGIGKATVSAFEKRGWKVWAGYRKEIPQELTRSFNTQWIPLDVTSDDMVYDAMEKIYDEDGRIDALVNNAGYGIVGLEEGIAVEEMERLFAVNFFGCVRLIQAVTPQMRCQGSGHIINISSTSGVRALPGLGVYAASKFALEGYSEGLAATLAPWGIHVCIVEPGSVKNEFAKHCEISEFPPCNPYAGVLAQRLTSKLSTLAETGQECAEIAELIADLAEEEAPDFRTQTSPKVRKNSSTPPEINSAMSRSLFLRLSFNSCKGQCESPRT
jgi:NAD(P)-dependent dehydrogenase (short-subunit alcohol dehydrogenase family)